MSAKVWHPAFVGIGSNLDDPIDHVRRAFGELDRLPETARVLFSPLYFSAPLVPEGQSPDDQDEYVNAVAGVLTRLSPHALLEQLQALEHAHGRDRSDGRWSARTLDLDMLAFNDQQMQTERLTLPHPELARRSFVLIPWRDIAPDFYVANLGFVGRLAREVDPGTLRPVNSPSG